MKQFEELIEIDAVGGTTDVLVTADQRDGIQLAITDADGEVVVAIMNEAEARQVQNALLAAANAYTPFGGAA